MKTFSAQDVTLHSCLREARKNRVVVTSGGKPVALILSIDTEQVELGKDSSFWSMIEQRRRQKTISRKELEKRLAGRSDA